MKEFESEYYEFCIALSGGKIPPCMLVDPIEYYLFDTFRIHPTRLETYLKVRFGISCEGRSVRDALLEKGGERLVTLAERLL